MRENRVERNQFVRFLRECCCCCCFLAIRSWFFCIDSSKFNQPTTCFYKLSLNWPSKRCCGRHPFIHRQGRACLNEQSGINFQGDDDARHRTPECGPVVWCGPQELLFEIYRTEMDEQKAVEPLENNQPRPSFHPFVCCQGEPERVTSTKRERALTTRLQLRELSFAMLFGHDIVNKPKPS